MSSRREAPEPWASAMVERGMVDRGRPSMRQLALRADLSVETVRRMVYGTATPEVETVEAVADALGMDRRTVSSWIGRERHVDEPWSPPAEAGLLSPKVREALDQLIRAMTESEAASDGAPIVIVSGEDDPAKVVDIAPTKRPQRARKSPGGHPSG